MLAIIDPRMPREACEALIKAGFDICPLPPFEKLSAPVSGHPDMLLFFAPDAIITTKDYAKVARKELDFITHYTGLPLMLCKEEQTAEYPRDILLNAALLGETLFCFPQHTTAEITRRFENRICAVRQGYAKCSILPIGSYALITEDASIEQAAKKCGIDVLKIDSRGVELAGYSNGFLGGASSFAPYQTTDFILFCGDLDRHPNACNIRDFCKKYNQKIVSLGHFPLYDVGTIFLL